MGETWSPQVPECADSHLTSCRGVIFTHHVSDTSLPETGIVPPDQVLTLEEGDSRPSLVTGNQRSMQSFGD